jgi:hypothetical protein
MTGPSKEDVRKALASLKAELEANAPAILAILEDDDADRNHGDGESRPETASLTPRMRDALFIAAEVGTILGTRTGDLRYGNQCAVRTAWALEKRGLLERMWTGNPGDKYGAPYRITARGAALADALVAEKGDTDD